MSDVCQDELFNEYFITRDNNIREKIIERNMALVPYITYKYAIATGIKRSELNSYGYEGLLIAVDKYDPNLGYAFSTFAVSYILNYVRRGARDIRGFNKAKQYYSDFRKCYDKVIKEYYENKGEEITIYDDTTIVDEIINLMLKKGVILTREVEFVKNKINLIYCESYEEQCDLVSDFNLEEVVFNNILKETLDQMINELTPRQEFIIRERYGFNDGIAKTYDEIGKMQNVSGSRIHQIEKSALKKLKHPTRKKKLRDFYYE